MTRAVITLLLCLGLMGCEHGLFETSISLEQVKAQAEFDAAMAKAQQDQESAKCQFYGAKLGSDAYVVCMTNLSIADAQADAAKKQREKEDRQRKIDAIRRMLGTHCTTIYTAGIASTDCN